MIVQNAFIRIINADFSHLPYWEKTSVSAKPDYIPVVGLSFVPDQSVFSNLQENTSVRLIREYDNKYDKNAILVTLDDGRALGHISADWALILAPKIDSGIKYESKVTQIKTKVIIICIKRNNFDERVFYSIFNK